MTWMYRSIKGEQVKQILYITASVMGLLLPLTVLAVPEDDQQAFQQYFMQQAPEVMLESYADGVVDHGNGEQDDDRPYQRTLQQGRNLFVQSFKNGRGYAYCFRSNGIGIVTDYPFFDVISGSIKTLEIAINDCRKDNGEPALAYDSVEMTRIVAYMVESSRHNITNIIMPNDEAAMATFEAGKQFFFARRGQNNMACAHCHVDHAYQRYSDMKIPPALGLTVRAPYYDPKQERFSTLQQRFNQCLAYTKAQPLPLQGDALRNLEFYLTFMNNGIPLNGPTVSSQK